MKHDKPPERLSFKVLMTLVWFGLLAGLAKDLDAWYRPLAEGATRVSYSLLATIGFILFVTGVVVVGLWAPRVFRPLRRFRDSLGNWRWGLVVLVGIASSSFFLFTVSQSFTSGIYLRVFYGLVVLGASSWLAANGEEKDFDWTGLLQGSILAGSIFAFADYMQGAVNYPFSLSWSEGNRIWDYSVLYGRRFYLYPPDKNIPAYIDKGRQSLWGLPFLLPGVSIRMVRIWSGLVFTVPYAILGWFLFYDKKEKKQRWLFLGLWAFLFLNQGPIYTPLVLAAIIVVGARRAPTLLAFLLTALAGYYAQYSRSTWLFAPAMWAGMIALVEKQPYPAQTLKQRWFRAVALVMGGLVGGWGIPTLRRLLRAANAGVSGTSLVSQEGITQVVGRQPLLWNRLWPNPTNPLGIIPGLLLAVGPLVVLLLVYAARKRWILDIWQKAALLGGLAAFLVVGIVASVKIGGGNNLHNLDMFLIGVLVTTALAWKSGAKDWLEPHAKRAWWVEVFILAAVLYPALQPMLKIQTFILPDANETRRVLEEVRGYVAQGNQDGKVLFIDQRQLLTFGFVDPIPLVPDYEKKWMMDMAMANDAGYFEDFYEDLAKHRFSMIISEPLQVTFQGGEFEFGNENDAWVKWVSIPVLCYYEPVETYPEFGTQILVPKDMEPPVEGAVCPEMSK